MGKDLPEMFLGDRLSLSERGELKPLSSNNPSPACQDFLNLTVE
jgi:hypothetical protein